MSNESNTAYQAHPYFQMMRRLTNFLSEDFLGGPKVIKLCWVINFQKGGTLFFVGLLMWWYQNVTPAAWVYLALHGTYGLCWLLKDVVFPDPNYQKKVTLGGGFMSFATVLGPYWSFAFLLISDVLGSRTPPTMALLALCISLHTLGLAIMMVADAQKYYTLQVKRGLIRDGMFKYIRHPNYLGEMMIYGSYALIVQHWIPWAVLAWVWLALFLTNMKMKEASMSRYPEWADYKSRTGMLLPWL